MVFGRGLDQMFVFSLEGVPVVLIVLSISFRIVCNNWHSCKDLAIISISSMNLL